MLRSEAIAEAHRIKAAQEGFELKILDYLQRRPNDVFDVTELSKAILDPLYPIFEDRMKMSSIFIDSIFALIRAGSVERFSSYYGLKR